MRARSSSRSSSAVFGLVLLALGACGATGPFTRATPDSVAEPAVAVQIPDVDTLRPEPRPVATAPRTADTLDRTTAAERAAATAAAAGGTPLGETLASLGSPAEPGFWLRTGLVTRVQQGRVERVNGGGSVRLELRPSGAAPGAGSQMSLAAFRALDIPLSELVPLRVYAE